MRPTLALLLVLGLAPATARADRVLARSSSWNEAGTFIHTDVTVVRDDGRVEVVRVPGGVVDGIGMVQFALGAGGVVLADPLVGFVRSATSSGAPLRWAKSCVYVTPDTTPPPGIPLGTVIGVIDAALQTWEAGASGCSYVRFVRDDPASHEVGYDGHNVVKFRNERWCRPASGDDPEECYAAEAAAITTIFFIDRAGASDDGTIVDSDIEMNAVNFTISVGGQPTGPRSQSDLQNTLTHELGHVLGLDHTCWDGTGAQPQDDQGQPVPPCFPESALPAAVTEATMYNYQSAGETKKSDLTPDDVAGVCAIYPKAADPGVCERALDKKGCCAVAGGRGAPAPRAAPLAAVALLTLLRLRRRAT